MSSNQWNQPPADQGMPQGQPPMGYPGAMPPEKKSNTGLWVGIGCGCLFLLALLIGVIVLAVMLLSGDDSEDTGGGSTAASSSAPAQGGGGGGDQPAPAPNGGGGDMPQQVGDYTLAGAATEGVIGADYDAFYSGSGGEIEVTGAASPTTGVEDEKAMITGAQDVSGWTCGGFYGDSSKNICVKSTNGTDIIKVIGASDPQTLANFGEQFISAGGAS